MVIYTSILIAVLVIGTFSKVWERRWKGQQVAATEGEESISPLKRLLTDSALTVKLNNGVAALRNSLPFRQSESPLPHQFRSWSVQALAADVAVLQWLDRLSEPAHRAFVEHVAEFSEEIGFHLADLVNGQMAQLPSVAQSATQIITHYCRANYQAALAQSAFDGYRVYAAYLQSPMSSDSQRFTQQLYTQLVDKGLVEAPTPAQLTLTDQERLLQMQDAIRHAAERPDTFLDLIQTVVVERQRTTADLTVEKIVQRAMTKFVKPTVAASATAQTTAPDPANANVTEGTT